jgi:23S rRNA (guanosine2251-2'-O)-methyltransferase
MSTDIIEGRNPVIEALKAGRSINRILLDRNMHGGGAVEIIRQLARIKGIRIDYVDRKALEQQSSTGSSQGVIALTSARGYVDLDDLMGVSRSKNEPPLYLVLDGLEDPRNLGAILRTAEATGIHGVVIREKRAVGLTPAAVKASAGAAEYIPVAMVTNISQAILALKKNNVWAIGIDMAGNVPYTEVDYTLPTAIVIGGEGKGLSELTGKRCDSVASIPMKGKISSLNASVAAAVVMYEALNQRSRMGKSAQR